MLDSVIVLQCHSERVSTSALPSLMLCGFCRWIARDADPDMEMAGRVSARGHRNLVAISTSLS